MKQQTWATLNKLHLFFLVLGVIGLVFFIVGIILWANASDATELIGDDDLPSNKQNNLNIWVSSLVFYLVSYLYSLIISVLLVTKDKKLLTNQTIYWKLLAIFGFLPIVNLFNFVPVSALMIQTTKASRNQ